ncbi:MAG: HAD family hydrolase [Candidatus Aminicenantes bacterium]|nr:HAD family hydrolase [Candidatus Aminicenantes bacterium]
MIKTIIFDLDGTLIESLSSIVHSMNVLLIKEGFPTHPFDNYRMFVGDGVTKLVERSFPGINSDKIRHYVNEYIRIYIESWREKTIPFEGIYHMLKKFQISDINMFILSNKRDDLTKLQTAELFPDIDFLDVRGAVAGIPKKPDPVAAIEMLSMNNLSPEETIFIGDSGVDMQTAVKGGMISGGVLWGFRSREELIENGAEFLFESPLEIIMTVLEENG